ncbi:uncharacterized protein LOC125533172 [Triticum urartu]|uniref:uncharacterized protein LOC125533172 n=1 Tax=Triticum urartu TaxID=4572 RepID=UPI0020435433|nr:uncharacterized protein LOC125533172 [Triticum urartu]
MAALRVTARRLVGGGQTPVVAVDKVQRRLFPRLSQVDRARSTTSSAAAAAKSAKQGREDREKLLREIHNMREELYDKVSHAERTYDIPGRAGKHIRRLREELAVQVDPRPGDSTWRKMRWNSSYALLQSAKQGREDREKLLREIHNMREELYDKVSHAERTYDIPGRAGKHISQLREELAVQVDPRPGDSTCLYVLMGMAAGRIVELHPDEKQWIKKKRGEARKQSETK